MTPRPETGPWIIPANEAKGKYIHTEAGIVPITNFVPEKKLRPDQLTYRWINGRRVML
jgi:hypothetical protein